MTTRSTVNVAANLVAALTILGWDKVSHQKDISCSISLFFFNYLSSNDECYIMSEVRKNLSSS